MFHNQKKTDAPATDHQAGDAQAGGRVQLRRQIAGLTYAEQQDALRPPMPLGAVQLLAEDSGAVQFEEATAREGVELEEFTLLNGLKGRYAKSGTQAKSPQFETWAQEFETNFSNAIQTDPNALGGAQAMCDRAIEVVKAYVDTFNERLQKAKDKEKRLDEEMKTYDKVVAEWCGTPEVNYRGQSNLGIAGAVGPDKALAHMQKDQGNLRTKMTTIFNFMRPFSKTAMSEANKRTDDFFKKLGGDQDKLTTAILRAKTENRRKAAEHRRAKANAEKDHKPEPRKPRDSGLVGEPETGAVVDQASTRGRSGGDAQSTRKADTEGIKLHADELEFMHIDQEDIHTSRLTWNEGMNVWRINEDDEWVQKVRDLCMPLKAGPSGTTDRIMQTNEHLAATTPLNSRAAALAYLLGINAHSLIEIMAGAAPYGSFTEPLNSVAIYKEIKPFGKLQAHSPDAAFWEAVLKG